MVGTTVVRTNVDRTNIDRTYFRANIEKFSRCHSEQESWEALQQMLLDAKPLRHQMKQETKGKRMIG